MLSKYLDFKYARNYWLATLAKHWLVVAIVIALMIVVTYFVSYCSISNSRPYNIAEDFVRSNLTINAEVGEVRDVKLATFGNYLSYTGSVAGSANFKFNVIGNQDKAIVWIDLRRKYGQWAITAARIQLQNNQNIIDVQLNNRG